MLTFFRRIRKGLLGEGATSKYLLYAIGEIALVVIGILVALQINNWNEFKKERIRERVVLEDLEENIIRNNQLIDETLQELDDIKESANIVKTAVENKIAYTDTLSSHFSFSIRHGGFLLRLNNDGYESYKNAGFGIIRNEEIKDQILNLFEVTYANYDIELQWGNTAYIGFYGWWDDYFYIIENDLFVPMNYNQILADKAFMSKIYETMDVRASLYKSILKCLNHNNLVLSLIQTELRQSEK